MRSLKEKGRVSLGLELEDFLQIEARQIETLRFGAFPITLQAGTEGQVARVLYRFDTL